MMLQQSEGACQDLYTCDYSLLSPETICYNDSRIKDPFELGGRGTMQDHYAVLGVGRDASPDESEAAYRTRLEEIAENTHMRHRSLEQTVQEIQEAYTVLSDPQQRQTFDARRGQEQLRGVVGQDSPAIALYN